MDKPKKYEDRLMTAFAFDEDDLEANQAGRLTKRQVTRMNRERSLTVMGAAFMVLGDIVAVALVLGAVDTSRMTPAILVILAAVIATFTGLAAFIGYRATKTSADVRENRAAEVEGRVDLSVRTGQNSARYYLRVGDIRFAVKQQAFLALKNGDPYRIFYAPHSKRILSVEWLRENDDNLLEPPPESATIIESDAESDSGELKLRR